MAKIEDKKISKEIKDLYEYIESIKEGKKFYSKRKFLSFNEEIQELLKEYMNKKLEDKKIPDLADEQEIKTNIEFETNSLLNNIQANVNRSFFQAIDSIEKQIGIKDSNRGFFGLTALLSLLGIKQDKIESREDLKVDGFVRLTKNLTIYRIDIVKYLVTVIDRFQEDIDRKISVSIANSQNIDLVYVTDKPSWLGPNANEVCNRWKGKIISVNGNVRGFPKLQDALSEKPPLFHPNCRHQLHNLTQQEQEKAIQKNIKEIKFLR